MRLSAPSYRVAVATLIEFRKKAGMSQQSVADAMGKYASWVSKVEECERRLDFVEFIAFARAIGVKETDLLRAVAQRLPKKLE